MPTLAISPKVAVQGQSFDIVGTGFPAKTWLAYVFNGSGVTTKFQARRDGTFHVGQPVVSTLADGTYTLEVRKSGTTEVLASLTVPVSRTGFIAASVGQQYIDAVNLHRVGAGLLPIKIHDVIQKAAEDRAVNLATYDVGGHDNTILKAALGAAAVRWSLIGEVLRVTTALPPDPTDDVRAWMASDGHRAILINPVYTHAGASYATNPTTNRRRPVMLFVAVR